METILSPSFSPLLSKPLVSPTQQPKSSSSSSITASCSKKQVIASLSSPPKNKNLISRLQSGVAAAALSLAISFCPPVLLPSLDSSSALASEFDILNQGAPAESYVVDDANVLSRVTKSDIKALMSDLESRKNLHINFVTVRKLTSKADAFEYADQVLEKWYPTVEEGSNKGLVVLVTSQKEGAITGGPAFVQAVGDTILDATVSENLPGRGDHFFSV